jgi:hypothetical protein
MAVNTKTQIKLTFSGHEYFQYRYLSFNKKLLIILMIQNTVSDKIYKSNLHEAA